MFIISRGNEEASELVPLVDLKAQYLSIKEELDEALTGVIYRATFIEGEEVALFERNLPSPWSIGIA